MTEPAEGRTFITALNRNLTDAEALSGAMPANLRSAADVYSQAQIDALLAAIDSDVSGKEPTIAAGTSAQIWQGDKTWTAKTGLPISTATQTALDLKLTTSAFNATLTARLAAATAVSSGNLDYIIGLYGGNEVKLPVRMLTPAMFGAVGDGTTDDTVAMNALFAKARTTVVALGYKYIPVEVDLRGGVFRVTDSIDATGIQCWNLTFAGGVILGQCTGKPVIDLTGSRGYAFRDTHIEGSSTSMPTMPFLCARATATFGFCDNVVFDRVTTDGYFSVAAFFAYGQETATHIHCHYWNSCPTASVAIFEGYDSHPQTSAFKTVVTGGVSHINNLYLNCDFRYQPVSGVDSATITGITQANPAVVTCTAGHPFQNGDTVIIAHIEAGMTQINSRPAVVAGRTGTTFQLTGIDSSAFTAYTTGGFARRSNTQPAIYMNRMKQHRFLACYVVSYGAVAIEIGFPDNQKIEQCTFDFLQEGACSAVYKITGVGAASTQEFRDCSWFTYSTHAGGAFFDTDGSAAGRAVFYGCNVKVTSHIHSTVPLVTTAKEAIFAFYGIDLWWANRSGVVTASLTAFEGKFFSLSDGKVQIWGAEFRSKSDGAFTPTITASAGTITTSSGVGSYVRYMGNMVFVSYTLTITTNGTGSGTLRATLPANASANAVWILNGRANAVGGQQLQGMIAASGTFVGISTDDNTYPAVDGEVIYMSGWYEKA